MSTVAVPGLWLPAPIFNSTTPSFGSFLLDATGEKFSLVMAAPKSGSIHKVHFRVGTVNTPTDTDVRIEAVSTTDGNPTGTLFGTNTNVTVASGSISSNTFISTGALTADASVTAGDLLAVVIAPSGSPNFNVSSMNTYGHGSSAVGSDFPYHDHYNSGAWAKSKVDASIVALEYSDGSFAYQPDCWPASAVNTHSVSSSTTPDEVALKFSVAAPIRVSGGWAGIAGAGDVDYVLYSSDGSTVLATKSRDKDTLSSAFIRWPDHFRFSSSIQLSANTTYYLSIKPTSTTALTLYSFDVSAAGLLDVTPGGQNFHWAQQTDAGGWSATTTRRPIAGLMIDGIDDGTGGGSGGGAPIIGSPIVRAG